MCRPEVVAKATGPFLEVHAGRHPCVVQTFTGNEYIPNDTLINASQVQIIFPGNNIYPSCCSAVLLSRDPTWEASQL